MAVPKIKLEPGERIVAFPRKLRIRCRGCHQFKLQAEVKIAGCPGCDWHTAWCEDCGREKAAARGVRSHFAYFRKRGAEGHDHE